MVDHFLVISLNHFGPAFHNPSTTKHCQRLSTKILFSQQKVRSIWHPNHRRFKACQPRVYFGLGSDKNHCAQLLGLFPGKGFHCTVWIRWYPGMGARATTHTNIPHSPWLPASSILTCHVSSEENTFTHSLVVLRNTILPLHCPQVLTTFPSQNIDQNHLEPWAWQLSLALASIVTTQASLRQDAVWVLNQSPPGSPDFLMQDTSTLCEPLSLQLKCDDFKHLPVKG